MRATFVREVAAAGLPSGPGPRDPVTEADLAALPEPAQRLLRFMAVPGHPRTWSFHARWTGTFRRRPTEAWMPLEAWQYDTSLEVARIFHMRVRLAGLVPIRVRDTYVRGCGRMLGRVFDAVSIVDVSNERMDTGELVTYLNDCVLLAPSMLLGPQTTWTPVDGGAFDVAFMDRARTVRARVFVDERGAVTDFSTMDRYASDPAAPEEMVQARWSTPVRGWTTHEGRPIPTGCDAVWHFPSGDFTYGRFDLSEIELDVPPGAPPAS